MVEDLTKEVIRKGLVVNGQEKCGMKLTKEGMGK